MPQGLEATNVEGAMSNLDIMVAFKTLTKHMMTKSQVINNQAQAITSQANQRFGPQVNLNKSTF